MIALRPCIFLNLMNGHYTLMAIKVINIYFVWKRVCRNITSFCVSYCSFFRTHNQPGQGLLNCGCFGSLSVKDYGRSPINCLFLNLTLQGPNCFDLSKERMVSVRASCGAVWLLALDRALVLSSPSSLVLVCLCCCTSHIALLGCCVMQVRMEPTSHCPSPEQGPASNEGASADCPMGHLWVFTLCQFLQVVIEAGVILLSSSLSFTLHKALSGFSSLKQSLYHPLGAPWHRDGWDE